LIAAADIITRYTKVRIACVLELAAHTALVDNWRERMPKSFQPEAAYPFAVTTTLSEMARAAGEAGYDHWITYIIEAGNRNYGQLRDILDSIILQPEPRQTVRLRSFLPAKKTDYIELQAADFFAYWLREYAEAVD
jgi:hypothetical protein